LQDWEIDDDQMIAAADLADAVFENGQVPCQNDPDAWFPEKSSDNLPGYHGLTVNNGAREMCLNQCPLVLHCRAYALKHHEQHGIWGGLTYLERKNVWSKIAQTEGRKSRKGIPNRKH
jgi:hypothetical protein